MFACCALACASLSLFELAELMADAREADDEPAAKKALSDDEEEQ